MVKYEKYNLKDVLGYYTIAVHCPTEESLLKLIKLLGKKGIIITGLYIPVEQWWQKGENSVIYISRRARGYGDLEHAKKENHDIVSVYDYLFDDNSVSVLKYLL